MSDLQPVPEHQDSPTEEPPAEEPPQESVAKPRDEEQESLILELKEKFSDVEGELKRTR